MKDSELKKLLANLEGEMAIFCSHNLKTDGIFLGILKSSLMKSFELSKLLISSTKDKYAFFKLASLRGICEEYIDIRFIGQMLPADRDAIIQALLGIEIHEFLSKQTSFFKKFRPFQPVVESSSSPNVDEHHTVLEEISARTGLWHYSRRKPMQTAFHRANKLGLTEFYRFYYAITSEMVHFSPHVLLRMGWGADPWKPKFSTQNFSIYYREMILVYSLFLFKELIISYDQIIKLPMKIREAATETEKYLNFILRWPEPVTFEEMNLKGPGQLMRILLKVGHEHEAKQ